jgi:hypothetical protein
MAFENIAKYASGDLGFTVEVERFKAQGSTLRTAPSWPASLAPTEPPTS